MARTRWSSTPLRAAPGAQRSSPKCPSPKGRPSRLSSRRPQRPIRSGKAKMAQDNVTHTLCPWFPQITHFMAYFANMLQIKVDGKDFYTYHHRVPLERVCAIEIKGDVSVQTINFLAVRRWALIFCVGADLCLHMFMISRYEVTTWQCLTTTFCLSCLCCIRILNVFY